MDQLELTKVTHINSGILVVRISNCFPAHVVLSARYVHVESIEIAGCVFFFSKSECHFTMFTRFLPPILSYQANPPPRDSCVKEVS